VTETSCGGCSIEVVLLATEGISELKPALALANATQKEFNFSIISGELPDRAKLAVYRTIVIKDFFDSLQNIRR
jgi:hypothetical protein